MKPLCILLSAIGLFVLSACGDGGGTGAPVQGSISGMATKGPVHNATVTAYGISSGQMGTQIATTTTDANGLFTMTIGGYAGPVMMRITGGSYTDEATGFSIAMAPGAVMTAVMPAIAAGASIRGVQVTPVTSMAQTLALNMSGGMTDANIAAANTAMGNYFSVSDILHVQPMNPLVTDSGLALSQDARNYGMTLAAMSQYAKALNMTNSSLLIAAMMSDASDGVMDGKAGATQISMSMGGMMGTIMMPSTSGTSSLVTAMTAFISSPENASGLITADMDALMQKLNGSNGSI
jgi:hypothetical protein